MAGFGFCASPSLTLILDDRLDCWGAWRNPLSEGGRKSAAMEVSGIGELRGGGKESGKV